MVYLAIKELLRKNKKSKYWLVKNIEMGYQTITDMMEGNTKGIKFETIDKLCKVFNCTPNDLFKIK